MEAFGSSLKPAAPTGPSSVHVEKARLPPKMEQWMGKNAIVTGASAGIGAAIAKKFLENGINVVAIGRRLELLELLSADITPDTATLYPLKCDLLDENQIEEAVCWIRENVGPISILVNNAGIFNGSTNLIEGDSNIWRDTIKTNCISLLILTKEVIKIMKENQIDGLIINVSSISGLYVPTFKDDIPFKVNIYPSSKHAVRAISRALRYELNKENSKIKVSILTPGITLTEVFRNHPAEDIKSYQTFPFMMPDDVAKAVLYILSTPPQVQVEELIVRPVGEFI